MTSLVDAIKTISRDESQVLVFPNPFSAETTLNLKNFSANSVIEISNLSGQILYHEKVTNINSGKIGSELPKGMYILLISDGDKRITNKIIKR